MKYCEKLDKPIIDIEQDECPNDCRKCKHCIEKDKLEKKVFPHWKD